MKIILIPIILLSITSCISCSHRNRKEKSSPYNYGIDIVNTDGGSIFVTSYEGLKRKKVHEETFHSVFSSEVEFQSILGLSTSGGNLYLLLESQVLVSENDGESFQSLPINNAHGLTCLDTSESGTIIVGNSKSIFISKDGGETFESKTSFKSVRDCLLVEDYIVVNDQGHLLVGQDMNALEKIDFKQEVFNVFPLGSDNLAISFLDKVVKIDLTSPLNQRPIDTTITGFTLRDMAFDKASDSLVVLGVSSLEIVSGEERSTVNSGGRSLLIADDLIWITDDYGVKRLDSGFRATSFSLK